MKPSKLEIQINMEYRFQRNQNVNIINAFEIMFEDSSKIYKDKHSMRKENDGQESSNLCSSFG